MPSYPYALTITNPGAETGDTTGWTDDTSTLVVRTTDTGVTPRTGTYYFCATADGATSKCHQTITLPTEILTDVDTGGYLVTFGAYQNGISADSDTGGLGLVALDGADAVLDSVVLAESHITTAWTQKGLSLILPTGTRKVSIELYGTRATGPQLSVYWDDLTASVAAVASDITYVGSVTGTAANADFTLTFPEIAENDIVVVGVVWSDTADVTPGVNTAGYTEVAELYANDNYDCNLSVSYKRMGASPDAAVSIDGNHGIGEGTAAVAYILRGVDTTTALDVAVTTATGTDTAIPDPPSITPLSSGAFLVIVGGSTGVTLDNAVTPPSGFTNGVQAVIADSLDASVVMASKTAAGGAEDPGVWTDWGTDATSSSWCAVTMALRKPAMPTTGDLDATETGADTAAISGLTVHTTGDIDATETGSDTAAIYATSGLYATGTLAATETGSDSASVAVDVVVSGAVAAVEAGSDTASMAYTVANAAALVLSLPPFAVAIEARGVNGALVLDLPVIEFFGETSAPAWLAFDLPALEVLLGSGSGLNIEVPFQELAMTAVSGATCSLEYALPAISFDAQTGAALAFDLAVIEAALTGTTGLAADLHLNFPVLEVLLEGTVGQLAQLQISLPPIGVSFTASQQILGVLLLEIPPLQVLLSGSVGTVGSIVFDLPVPEILMSSYEDISGSLVVTLPVPRFYLEGAAMARFDNYILSYTRPS